MKYFCLVGFIRFYYNEPEDFGRFFIETGQFDRCLELENRSIVVRVASTEFADVSVIADGFGATYVSFYFSINHVLHILRATSSQLDPSLFVPLRVETRYKSTDRIKRTSSLACTMSRAESRC